MVEAYPFGAADSAAPHPRYAALREESGLARIKTRWGGEGWLATRYQDVKLVLGDQRFSRELAAGREEILRPRPSVDAPEQMISMDPPNHTRLRRLVAKAFTAHRVEELRPRVTAMVDDLLDQMDVPARTGDLATALAWPLPMMVISEMLGVPEADRDNFRRWTELVLALGTETTLEEMTDARGQLNGYLADLIAQRRVNPTTDLLSDLVAARDEGDRLSEEELIRLGVTLLIAGHETTANQIGNFVFVLLDNDRAGWRHLVASPDVVPKAVEELLRYVPMAASADFARVAREDVEVGGHLVRAGETVLVQIHAANRDSSVFEAPDDLDLARTPNQHIAFGFGVHHCLGVSLARLELRIVLSALLARFPDLRLNVPAADVPWRTDRLVRGVRALPVAW
ncbi:cytochrome P450 [Kibdelosporangium philippinense]|uniref:Cytochrome P450 n=1 Tax=Kibdelosporangium philippinense TaxID=211113 RepID=A0ABS8ZTN5_9PSEU|nr:cytochrome P450 [Kibdelosporangium philippinense]MCE7011085.1 cytochrome P450 [Kibdelosporangium philippinense]